MSDYTPTTEEVVNAFAQTGVWLPIAGYAELRGAFGRWLAAHDAEKRAEWEAEQGETEWEYGSAAIEDDGDCPRPLSEDRDFWPAGITAHASEPSEEAARRIIAGWQNATLVRRRKAGPWEPVPVEGGENDG